MTQGDGMKAYVSYKVQSVDMFVVRRYSDFVWLRDQLEKEFVGYLIPPLPEKKTMGRFEAEFIEVRRRYLQKFLRRVAEHPALRKSQDFRDFMTCSQQELVAVKASKSKSKTASLLAWFSESVSAVSQSLTGAEIPKTEADMKFNEMCTYVDALLPQLEHVSKHLEGLLKHHREYATSLEQFGLAFTLLGQAETDRLGGPLSQLGHTADRLSNISKEHVDRESLVFAEPLKDYIALTNAVKSMLEKRKEKYNVYSSTVAEHRKATSSLHDLKTQGGRVQMSKIHAAENTIAQAKVKMISAKDALHVVDQRVCAEIAKFKSQKMVDFRNIVLSYVQQQVEYQKRSEAAWRKLIPKLEQAVASSGYASSSGVEKEEEQKEGEEEVEGDAV